MNKKNGLEFSIAPSSFAATALFALCNLSLSAPITPTQLNYKSYSMIEEASNSATTSLPLNSISTNYFNTSTAREALWGIFGETRDLTESEADIYDQLLNARATKTGIRLL